MATSLTLSPYSGYPTDTAMRVWVSFTVTYAGSYYPYFELYTSSGSLVTTSKGSTVTLNANGSQSDIYKTFTGLSSGTSYYIVGSLWNASTNQRLSITEPRVNFTTEGTGTITVNYYDGSKSDTASSESSVTVRGPMRTDWDFVGWATSTSDPDISYEQGDTISAGSSDKTVNLYAVYKKDTSVYCYFLVGDSSTMESNTRTKTQYRCNTSKTASSTSFYNTITLPNFSSANSTISTPTPNREWTAIGWRQDTTAGDATYSPGESVSGDRVASNFYAVYSNECWINYYSNGGSGSMSDTSESAYYSASNRYTTPTLYVDDCIFTAPSGKSFSHWNTKADGSGTSYDIDDSVTTNYTLDLYAIWKAGRPSNWSWTTTGISSGSAMNSSGSAGNITAKPLTAAEWLNFANRIKEFYSYKGKTVDSTYWYRATNGVVKGSPMTSTQANGVRYLIDQLSPPTAVPSAVSAGSKITAAFINGLKNSLNSIT